jgi:AcrR family transcriptional regulator
MSPRPRATSDAVLLTATLNTVSRLGPTRMTLADVAREAGVSPATLVQRFGSKRGLLLALAASSNDGVSEQFAQIRAAHPSPLAALDGVADCMAQMAVSPEVLSNSLAFLQIDLVDPDFHKHALAHSRAMRTEIKALLDEAIATGELAWCDTNRLARGVQVVLGGALLQWAIDRDGSAVNRLREDLDTLIRPRHAFRERRRTQRKKVRRD